MTCLQSAAWNEVREKKVEKPDERYLSQVIKINFKVVSHVDMSSICDMCSEGQFLSVVFLWQTQHPNLTMKKKTTRN